MNKKYLMNGLAALAIVAGISSCVKDVDGVNPADQEKAAKENAELQLGLTIPEGQTWEMSQQIAANVTVDLNAEETYTVGICDKNPLNFEDAKYYALKKVEGGKISATFTAPIAKSDYYVIAYNSKYQAIVNKVEASNGVINANVSYTSGASGTMRSARRAIQSIFEFPSAPDKNVFATTVPNNCPVLTGYQNGNLFEINGTSASSGQKLQPYVQWDATNKKIDVYVSESVTLNKINGNDPVYFPSDVTLYLLPNVKMTINCDYNWEQSNGIIYIADGAELAINGVLGIGSNCKIITAGTGSISANQIIVRNGATLYNQGTIDMSEKDNGELSVENSNSVIVNDGTIKAKRLHTAGSGHVQNNGNMIISGNTDIDSNNNTWVNNGSYQTQYFFYTAGSCDVINNCKLIVDEDFNINLGDTNANGFQMDSNASTITKNFNGGGNFTGKKKNDSGQWVDNPFNGGPFFITMGASSMFEVTETATMNATKADYGIYGPEEGAYAVFKAKTIVAGKENQGYEVTYGNNLAVVCESHFAQGYSGSYPYIDYKGNASLYEGSSAAPDMEAIKASLCSGEFNPGSGTGKFPKEPEVYTFAFEDQIYNGDYDMNDVVLKVSYHAERNAQRVITGIDESKLDIKLVASGATFNIKVYLGQRDADGKPIEGAVALFGDKEIHAAFGVDAGLMVNTGRNTANVVTLEGVTPPADWDGDFENLDIWIWVNPGTGSTSETQIFYLTDKEKPVPYAIMVPTDWAWPTERTKITEAYPGKTTSTPNVYDENFSFKKWAETPAADRTDAMEDWFNWPIGLTMKNN